MKLSLEELKKTADQELQRQGYDLSKMSAIYDENNSDWYIPMLLKGIERMPDLRVKIAGHDYIIVLYKQKPRKGKMIVGGDGYVFVDRNTGEILLFLEGK